MTTFWRKLNKLGRHNVVTALTGAKVSAAADTQPERELLGQLASAAVLMKGKHYDEARRS